MPIAFTSRTALAAVIAALVPSRRAVYDAIAAWEPALHGPGPSIEDIARKVAMKESSVCGRVNELLTAEAIELAPVKTNATGHTAKTYRALVYKEFSPPPKTDPQTDLFADPLPGTSQYSREYF